jgi:hypothetical protein
MKKLLLLITFLTLWICVRAQQHYWPSSVPPGSNSYAPSYRFTTGATDSLNSFYFSNGVKFYQFYTAVQMQRLLSGKADSARLYGTYLPRKLDTTIWANDTTYFNNYILALNGRHQLVITPFKYDGGQFQFDAKVNFTEQTYFINDIYQTAPRNGSGVLGVYALDNTQRMVVDTMPHVSQITVQDAGHSATLTRYGLNFTDYGTNNSLYLQPDDIILGNTTSGIYSTHTPQGLTINNGGHAGTIGVTGAMSSLMHWNFPAGESGNVILDADTANMLSHYYTKGASDGRYFQLGAYNYPSGITEFGNRTYFDDKVGIGTINPFYTLSVSNGGAYTFDFDPVGKMIQAYDHTTFALEPFTLSASTLNLNTQIQTATSAGGDSVVVKHAGKLGARSLPGVLSDIGAAPASTSSLTPLQQAMIDVNGKVTTQPESVHQPVKYATITQLPSNSYNNGTSGIGATLTATANGALSVDGVAVVAGDRLLVWQENNPANDGIYTVTATGDSTHAYVLTRSNYSSVASNMAAGMQVYVQAGNSLARQTFQQTAPGAITIGTTPLNWQILPNNLMQSPVFIGDIPSTATNAAPQSILFYGNSIVAASPGTTSHQKTFTYKVAVAYGVQEDNHAASGTYLTDFFSIPAIKSTSNPTGFQFVMSMYGANEAALGDDTATYHTNRRKMADTLNARGFPYNQQVILGCLYSFSRNTKDFAHVDSLVAIEKGCKYVDLYWSFIAAGGASSTFLPDGLHPSNIGSLAIYNQIINTLGSSSGNAGVANTLTVGRGVLTPNINVSYLNVTANSTANNNPIISFPIYPGNAGVQSTFASNIYFDQISNGNVTSLLAFNSVFGSQLTSTHNNTYLNVAEWYFDGPPTGTTAAGYSPTFSNSWVGYTKTGNWYFGGNIQNNVLTASKLVFTDASKNLTSTGIGPSTSFIMADGSANSTAYLPLAGGTETGPVTFTIGNTGINTPGATALMLNVTGTSVRDATANGLISTPFTYNYFSAGGIGTAHNGVTYTTAATVYIAGPVTAGGAGYTPTITNSYSLDVASGNSNFGGNITASGAITFSGLSNGIAHIASGVLSGSLIQSADITAAAVNVSKTDTTHTSTGLATWNNLQTYLTKASATSTYAPLASPVFTGTPTAPTATVGTNTTQIATTAFVLANSAPAFGTQTANTVYSGPSSGSAATPNFRSLVAADIPTTVGNLTIGTSSGGLTLPGTVQFTPTASPSVAAGNGGIYISSIANNYFQFSNNNAAPFSIGATGSIGWILTSANTGSRTYTLPDASGTVALTATTPQIKNPQRATAQTAATTLTAYTVGASDGSFIVSSNVNVTTSTLHSFSVTVTYTDETNTSRVLTLNFSQLTGAFVTTITNGTGASAYEGVPVHIRAKAGTTIQFATTGTFTTVTYNFEGILQQIN